MATASDDEFWDRRFGAHEYVYGTEPNDFLFDNAPHIPPGRVLCLGEGEGRLAGWQVREVRPLTSFNYFASGGFSGPQLGGRFLHGLMRFVDLLASPFPRSFAARLIVVLEKDDPARPAADLV